MLITLQNVLILFTFILIGYILKKSHILDEKAATVLSQLEVFVFMPSLNLKTLASQFNIQYFKEKYIYLITAIFMLIATIIIGKLLAKLFSKDKFERGIYAYILTIPNFSYTGYALMSALYGETMLMNMIIYTLPLTFYTYTDGFRLVAGKEKISFKNIINPILISIGIGCVLGLFSIHIPGPINIILTNSASCMAPVSMILTGLVIAEFNILDLILKVKYYIITFFRLILIPLVCALTLKLLSLPNEVVLVALMIYTMPAGINTIIFPKIYHKDCEYGAGLVLISNILSIATIPLMLKLFGC